MAFLEVPGEEREAGEESEEIGEGDPFMGDLREETGNARSIREPGKQDLVNGDVSAKRMKSSGIPKRAGRFGLAAISVTSMRIK
jgi:hypothetical protein